MVAGLVGMCGNRCNVRDIANNDASGDRKACVIPDDVRKSVEPTTVARRKAEFAEKRNID